MDSSAWDEGPPDSLAGVEEVASNKTAVHESSWSVKSADGHRLYRSDPVDASSKLHHTDSMNASLTKADVARLNDTLRASGLAPVRREADVVDIIDCAVHAVNELNTRHRTLLNASYTEARDSHVPDSFSQPKAKQTAPPIISEPVISLQDYQALLDENRRVSLIAQKYKTEATSIERSLRLKSEEVDRLSSRLQLKYREEDQRAALAMSAIRDNKMPNSTLLVIENYQKQIASLESENSGLAKRNASMMHRLKVLEADRNQLHAVMKQSMVSDSSFQNMKEECDNLKQCVDLLEDNLAKKDARIKELETKYFEQVEQNHFSQKHASASKAVSSMAAFLGCSDDPHKVVEKVKQMESVITGVFPKLESFARDLVGDESDEVSDQKVLDRVSDEIHVARNHSLILHAVNTRLNQCKQLVRDSDMGTVVERVERLVKQASSPAVTESQTLRKQKEILHELVRILGTESVEELASVAHRLVFKTEETSNFFKRLAAELGLSDKASFSQIMDQVRRGIRTDHRAPNKPNPSSPQSDPVRFRMCSSDSDSDLALSREIIRVSRK